MLELLGRAPFVGRQPELSALTARLAYAAPGHGGVNILAGEPGIGKTRLLDEVAGLAEQDGVYVLRGGASDAEGMPPYLPFLEALGRHLRTTPPEVLVEQAGLAAAILGGILPELAVRIGELPASYPLPPEQARLRLFEAVGDFLAAIAAAQPTLLILDDLQWADAATSDLLCHVAAHQAQARLIILGAYRPGEVECNPALERAIAELTRHRLLTLTTLGRFAERDVLDLAAASLGKPVDPALGQLLYTSSEGNPFFAEELLRNWIEAGVLGEARGWWTLLGAPDQSLPPSIVRTIRQRLARLPSETWEALRAAATIGRTFQTSLLAEVMGEDIEPVEERLGAAIRAQLIRDNGNGFFIFSHDTIRECLYEEIMPARRARLHGTIGRALEVRGRLESARQLSDLAFHFVRSGDRERGVAYAQRAAEEALHTFAAEEALQHCRAALDLLNDKDANDKDARRDQVLLLLGEAALLAGADREAVGAYEAAQEAFLRAGDPRAAARAAHGAGRAHARLEEHGPAEAALARALALLEGRPQPETVKVLVDLANLLAVSLGRWSEGIARAQMALDLAHQLADHQLEAAATRTVGNLLARGTDIPGGAQMLEQALTVASTCDDAAEAAECCACLVPAYYWLGDLQHANQVNLRRLDFAERCGDRYQMRHSYSVAALLLTLQGQWAEAEQYLDRSLSVVQRLASDEPLAFLRQVEGLIAYNRGDFVAAETSVSAAMDTFRGMGPAALVWYLGLFGLIQLGRGRVETALATMVELDAAIAAHSPSTTPTVPALTFQGGMAVRLGDHERARSYYAELAAFRGLNNEFLVDRVLGELAVLLGDWPAAEASLAAAEATARRESMAPELGRILMARADLELARRGPTSASRARELLKQALNFFDRFEMAGESSRVQSRLRSLPRQPGPRLHPSLPGGLSQREVAILRLVADGKTNREIASELALSRKTVANHLTSIFNKTGSDNRAAATAFAVRRHLV